MKITNEIQEEIKQVMDDYWNAYFDGKLEHWANYLVDDYKNIGGTQEEIWNSKKEILEYTHRIIDQMQGATELRNKQTQIIPYDPYVMVHELLDIFIKIEDEWNFYQKFRLSSLIQKTAEGWKVLHQHGSYPDSKTTEGEAFAFDSLKNENEKLQKAIKERTIELEQKNQELAIEAALDRIRRRTLEMKDSNELADAAAIFFDQFRQLGFLPPNARTYFSIIDRKTKEGIVWITKANGTVRPGSHFVPMTTNNPTLQLYEAIEQRKSIHIRDLTGDVLANYLQFLSTLPHVQNDESLKQLITNPPHRIVYTDAIHLYGTVGIMALEPITEEAQITLTRFAKVFEFTYTRFLDLQKAETQAREAKIEAALEKVRSRTMAMQHSDELPEAANVLFLEVQALGIPAWSCGYNVLAEDKKTSDCWMSSEGAIQAPFTLYFTEEASFIEWYDFLQSKESFYVQELGGKGLEDHYNYMRNIPKLGEVIKKLEDAGISLPTYQINHLCKFTFGFLLFITYEPVPEAHDIFKRFAKVFEQTYTRFLDLQKAEAQAREAKIEAGLERVRSQSMGMQTSKDLSNVTTAMFEQLRMLGGELYATGIVFCDKLENHVEQWHSVPGAGMLSPFIVPVNLDRIHQYRYDQWEKGTELFSVEIPEDFIAQHFDAMFNLPTVKAVLEDFAAKNIPMPETPSWEIDYGASFKHGYILVSALQPFTDAPILPRFAKVFEQTYTRFLDLQKAEAQAREAVIELGLERVRARTMAMQKSDELNEVVSVLFEKLKELQIPVTAVGIGIYIDGSKDLNAYVCGKNEEGLVISNYRLPYFHHKICEDFNNVRKKQLDFFVGHYSKEEKKSFYKYVFEHVAELKHLPDDIKNMILESPSYTISMVAVNNALFNINDFEGKDLSENEIDIIKRFAKVFDQTYTRFLDLQKAEAQAREAKIETALEKIRSRTMAMQKSEELKEVIQILYKQFIQLNIHIEHTGFVLDYVPGGDWHYWVSDKNAVLSEIKVPYFDSEWGIAYRAAKENGTEFFVTQLNFEEKNKFYHDLLKHIPGIPDEAIQFYFNCAGLGASTVVLDNVGLYIENFSGIPYSDEENAILMRFGKVFQQTYTRFLDLQKAEAQARESQVEAALERVRFRAMAMQTSADVGEATSTMFVELDTLGIETYRCGIAIIKDHQTMEVWSIGNAGDARAVKGVGTIEINLHPLWQLFYNEWNQKKDFLYSYLTGKEKEDYVRIITHLSTYSLSQTIEEFPDLHFHGYNFEEGAVFTFSLQPHSDEDNQVMKRFTSVFSLTFRRYKDLQKAEANARESQIEAALERVRSRATAMQKPNELIEVAQLLRKEMGLLGVEELETSSIYIHNENLGITECWYAIQDIRGADKNLVTDHMTIHLNDTSVGREMMKFYNSDKKQTSISMQGENRKEWINYCAQHSKVLQGYYGEDIPERTYHLVKFYNGYMGAASPGEISAESWDLLKRATTVFSLAYTRFSDLQIAEASTKETVKQAALDRIRADIASMRTTDDLDRITPLIWKELTILNIPFIRCGVFIMDDAQQLIHTFLSTPDGKAIAAFRLPYNSRGNISEILKHWQQNKIYSDHWDEKAFKEFADSLAKQEALTSTEQYLKTIPTGGFYLHFVPFLQGMLYVGNTMQLDEEEIKLLQSVADAFSTAYARYEDFNKLEAAKQQVDKTLVDLKQTQAQLVQSEKMASLGELTAGIAHEIQNPLNFVNNFSEVNTELIDEMKEEIDKGNLEEAKTIAKDIKDNEQKINLHGKRADAIVKGMLQHSRSSSGVKEPTDINSLCDEYLRLSYHGLRAKDKSFNATFKTDFDNSIEKINIIPQDIGRVVLNLLTNAFYAVNEKKKSETQPYEPIVAVSTKKRNNKVEIKVSDNGNGIPQKVLDKIFQPFFTTKPTGQGTGLGLSLSYDIIKAHGGEIKVETKEGEGTVFVLVLVSPF